MIWLSTPATSPDSNDLFIFSMTFNLSENVADSFEWMTEFQKSEISASEKNSSKISSSLIPDLSWIIFGTN